MSQLINFNPQLMMLYNLEPNVLVIGAFNNWDQNEDQLLSVKEPKLKVAMMNLATIATNETGVYPLQVIKKLVDDQHAEVSYLIQAVVEENFDQASYFQNVKSLLNVQQVVVSDKFFIGSVPLKIDVLETVFGKENVMTKPTVQPGDHLKKMKSLLQAGDVKTYFEQTKTPFTIKGQVVHGKKLGRELGFPTANVLVNPEILLKQGVYQAKVKLPNNEQEYWAMSCYWINEAKQNVIETYLFDFHKEIYDWFIEINFYEFIRENVPVKNEEELKALLTKDAQWIKTHQ